MPVGKIPQRGMCSGGLCRSSEYDFKVHKQVVTLKAVWWAPLRNHGACLDRVRVTSLWQAPSTVHGESAASMTNLHKSIYQSTCPQYTISELPFYSQFTSHNEKVDNIIQMH